MGEQASRVNVSSGVITFNPCLQTEKYVLFHTRNN